MVNNFVAQITLPSISNRCIDGSNPPFYCNYEMNKFLRQIYSELPFLTHYVTNYYKIILGYNLNKFAPSIKKKKTMQLQIHIDYLFNFHTVNWSKKAPKEQNFFFSLWNYPVKTQKWGGGGAKSLVGAPCPQT